MKADNGFDNPVSDLIKRIIEGETSLFSVLVERHRSMVFKVCMGYFHNIDEAEDMTQEIFLKAYLSLKSFRSEAAFPTWLYRISVNSCMNHVRKQKNSPFIGRFWNLNQNEDKSVQDLPASIPDFDDPESIIIKDEHRRWLQNMLDSLPDSQRTALILSKYDDLSQKEIAEIMSLSEGAVEALLQRAKKNLRERMQNSIKKNSKRP